jgi:hypothetical protein
MANRYGEAALMAARNMSSTDIDPLTRWESAMAALYPTSPSARKKGSPRGAFLGLCEAGLVRSIPAGHYSASADNKAYAVRAAALLIEGRQNWSTNGLWRAVETDPAKLHNGQMDIVLALWKNDLIVHKT